MPKFQISTKFHTHFILGRSFEEGLLQAAVVGGATGFLISAAGVAYAKLKAGNSATGATEANPSASGPHLSLKEQMKQMMEALGMDPLGDTGPGLSFDGPGRTQKQLLH